VQPIEPLCNRSSHLVPTSVFKRGIVSRIRTVLTPVLAAATAVALLAACSSGYGAQTRQTYDAADGVSGNSGSIRVLNALVAAGSGATTGVISMTVVNRGSRDDELTGLTSPDGTVDLTGSGKLAAGQAVRFGADTDPAATINGLTARPGGIITLKLTFARTEPITLRTVVVPTTHDYADLTPAPEVLPESSSPSPSESGSSSSESGSPSESGQT
jgi:hypothetical protein